jgi:hypothetical protein
MYRQVQPQADESASHSPRLIDQDKGDLEVDAVLRNLAVFYDDLLLLDPRALDVLQRLDRTSDALLDGILKALLGTGK